MLRSEMSDKGAGLLPARRPLARKTFSRVCVLMRAAELTIYHHEQELQAKRVELLNAHSGGSAHKEKSGWGSKLGARVPAYDARARPRLS